MSQLGSPMLIRGERPATRSTSRRLSIVRNANLSSASTEEMREQSRPPLPADFCILVAEDDALFRYVTVKVLRGHGYRVLEAGDGLEALWIVQREQPLTFDLIVSGFQMPYLNGYELAREVKLSHPNILIVIVSGSTKTEDFPPDLSSYVVGVIPKPVDQRSLLERVRELLGT
jgi:CheY-like chemotaxis protein